MKFRDWHTKITAKLAESEPLDQRLSFEPRKPSLAYRQLEAKIAREQKARAA